MMEVTPRAYADGIPVYCAYDELADPAVLVMNPRNPNRHPEEQIRLLAKLIQHHGWRTSITVSKRSGFVVRGHGRLQAALALGVSQVPVDRQDYATEADEWADLLADNRIAELAETDMTALKDLLQELDTGAFDMELTGYTEDVLEELMTQVYVPEQEIVQDEVPDPPEEPVTRPGDLWILGPHRVLCGDSTKPENIQRLMAGVKVPAVLTDPPYQMGKDIEGDNLDNKAFNQLHVDFMQNCPVENDATMICFHSTRTFLVAIDASRLTKWKFKRMLWMYKPNDITFPWHGWILKSEAILVFVYGKGHWYEVHPYAHDCYEQNHGKGDLSDSIGGHPAAKPLPVVADLLSRIAAPRESVYDPFLGAGTTLIAAEKLGRICYGIEIDPRFVDVTIQRWEQFTGQKAVRA